MSKRKKSPPAAVKRRRDRSAVAEQNRKLASGVSTSLRPKPAKESEPLYRVSGPGRWSMKVWGYLVIAALILGYVYWPTIAWMVDSWQNEPDYGHGWFVLPLAIYLCYQRADKFPGASSGVAWGGLALVLLAVVMRIGSRMAYADFFDAYSLVPLIAGAVWCLLGLRAMLWALPAILFLLFAVPLPYRMESGLSWQLQGVATEFSTFLLRAVGLPAVSEGHVVWIGDEKLMVEEACSGLRIFVGMAACAYFWAVLNDRHWSDRMVLCVAAVPLALFVNAMRIVLIGVLYQWIESPSGQHMVHDVSGYLMIAASFALLGAISVYWRQVYKKVPVMTARETLRGSLGHS
ncbi:exosortase/archaeosortase family protein [Roseiconus lacunae]|uniref:exosortase/archaeosortase family protein n=1 Tax=Roseiconus lacunae TaxID=2605694 RepID=UPI0011F15F67|nr:exosortase/archaeosortase family protein [Roseiconus lacunae]MCD0458865.1 exosortase/archaeosortase family protein [Roseiconus lacunae]